MNYAINGHTLYAYTGGKTFDAGKPTLVLKKSVMSVLAKKADKVTGAALYNA